MADERAAEREEGRMDVGAPLVPDGEASEAVEPGEGALDDPAVAARLVAALDALAGDTVRKARAVALGLGRLGRQERGDDRCRPALGTSCAGSRRNPRASFRCYRESSSNSLAHAM